LLKSLFGGAIIRHQKDRNKDIAVLGHKINSLEVKKNKLYDLYIDDDYFTRDDLKRKLMELDRSIHSLKSHYKSLQVDQARLQVEVNNVIETFRSLPEMYGIANQEKKARILKEIAECVIVKKSRAGIEWKKPYVFFMKDGILDIKEHSSIEPGENLPESDPKIYEGSSGRSL